MTNSTAGSGTNTSERVRSFLVLLATLGTIAFNWLATTGAINGSTPAEISAKYPTLVTPADWAFTIWSLIYLCLLAFCVYQLLPSQIERLRPIRSIYIVSCVLNCAWIYLWQYEVIVGCFAAILILWLVLLVISAKLKGVSGLGLAETWFLYAPFGLYFGWVTVAALVNFAVVLLYLGRMPEGNSALALTSGLLILGAVIGVLVRIKFRNFFFPIPIAWAATGIAVKNSSETTIVVVSALVLVTALVTAGSVVTALKDSTSE
jgi:benzodiazapine receptor